MTYKFLTMGTIVATASSERLRLPARTSDQRIRLLKVIGKKARTYVCSLEEPKWPFRSGQDSSEIQYGL